MSSTATVLRNRLLTRARMRHLQVFVRVAELGGVKRAAEAVGLSQPAATHTLADLEALLDCTLFFRHARGTRLTPVGQALLPLARRILGAVDEGAEQVAAATLHGAGVVRVAAITAALSGLMVRAVPPFMAQHPDVMLQLHEADPVQQAALVAQGEVDITLCRPPSVAPERWRYVPLVEDRFAVIAAPGHPLLSQAPVGMAALAQATWLAMPVSSAAHRAFDALFANSEVRPAMRLVSTRLQSIMWALLMHEPVLVLLPYSFARQFVDAGQLVEVPIERAMPFEPIGMLMPEEEEMGEAARVFAGFLERFAARERA